MDLGSGICFLIPGSWTIIARDCEFLVFTRDNIYSIARMQSPVRLSVRPYVRRVYHRKPVEVRIMKFSPYGSAVPLVFAG